MLSGSPSPRWVNGRQAGVLGNYPPVTPGITNRSMVNPVIGRRLSSSTESLPSGTVTKDYALYIILVMWKDLTLLTTVY